MHNLEASAPAGCPCYGPTTNACVCSSAERTLRAVLAGEMPPLTAAQREECLEEIQHIEGWDRNDHEDDTDQDLARSVLDAWVDYCRDQGML